MGFLEGMIIWKRNKERSCLFSYHSAKIESEVMKEQEEHKKQSMLHNQERCSRLLLNQIAANTAQLSIEEIKEIHGILMDGIMTEEEILALGGPGQFRGMDCEALLSGTDAGDIEKELRELFDEMTEISVCSEGDILKEATYLHVKIIDIFPFAYGNEIVARNLLNYYLMMNDHPPVVIFWDDRERYFKTLADYCNSGNIESLVSFLKWQQTKVKSI